MNMIHAIIMHVLSRKHFFNVFEKFLKKILENCEALFSDYTGSCKYIMNTLVNHSYVAKIIYQANASEFLDNLKGTIHL